MIYNEIEKGVNKMRYEDMTFKIPVESPTYKADSEFVIEQMNLILDRQKDEVIIKLSSILTYAWAFHWKI